MKSQVQVKTISKWATMIFLLVVSFGATSFADSSDDFKKMMELAQMTSQMAKHQNSNTERTPSNSQDDVSVDPQPKIGGENTERKSFVEEGRHSSPKSIQEN